MESWQENVQDIVSRTVQNFGYDLVETSISRSRLIVFVDKFEGGITIDECRSVSNEIANRLDMENIMADKYVLEVSSPGPDRPLLTRRDFQRVINKKIVVFTKQPIDGQTMVTGGVQGADEHSVTLAGEHGIVAVPYNLVNKAKVKFEIMKGSR
jgi:ribosome maturation factor RimP